MILVHPFVVSALKTAVNLGAFVHETTRIQHDVDFACSGWNFSGSAGPLPWCTTPIEAESSLGPDSHHPIISLSGIPSAVMVLRILHPILASTLCAANPLARIAEPTIAL